MLSFAFIPTFCGLIASLTWGSADYFAAKVSKNISPVFATLFIAIASALVYGVFYLIHPSIEPWIRSGILYGISAGLFMGTGLLMFYHGLDVGPVSIVSPIGSAYPLVTAFVVLTFFGGKLTTMQVLGILLVVLGITAASGLLTAKKSERRITAGVAYALFTFILWGFAFALLGQAVSKLGWEKATLVDVWFELVAIAIASIFIKGREKLIRSSFKLMNNKYVWIVSTIQIFGLAVFNFGITKSSSTAVITAISATYPALTIFLAIKHFGEKTTFIPLAGAFTTILGVVLLTLK